VLGGEPILPLPREVNWDPVKASLGERLFHDRGMSASQNIACASCHDMGKGGADGQVRSMQSDGKLTLVNTPTLYNVAYSAKLFWNGRADTLWQEFEMNKTGGVNWKILPARFGADTQYAQSFARLYPKEGITVHTIRDALFNYEQSLVTPNARFDRYLRGERQAITAAELQGYRLFKSYGCVSCHQGVNIGGNLFQKLGVMTDYFSERGTPLTAADNGRYEVTHHEEDRYVFRVPSLRNVALTAPYFHDGSAKTLQAAIADMAEHQLGIRMPGKDGILIEGFLKTLTGEYRGRALAP
jgi:cytochrome c peroxidase